ncbi:MAG: acetyl-CoA carboxylase biotin carboxyl carrier protein [Nitrospirota bacterium]|nr:acetyl-CoA carboxylase biotin carboxyl carrier protein [Nitrospirota bacterium]
MNLKELKELIDIINGTEISEIELEKSGTRVRIKKGVEAPQFVTRPEMVHPVMSAAPVVAPAAGAEAEAKQDNLVTVNSMIVGTFYRSPSPDAKPYVELNDVVKKGQVLCLVEAMKLMNEIESDIDGKIVEILVRDAQPVQYGQPLFRIEPM